MHGGDPLDLLVDRLRQSGKHVTLEHIPLRD
jgi:hypothetical protein